MLSSKVPAIVPPDTLIPALNTGIWFIVTTPSEAIMASASEAEPIVPPSLIRISLKIQYHLKILSMSAVRPNRPPSAIFISWLNMAVPASLPSRVKKVVSAPPSVPLKIMSLLACASKVILPEDVAMVTAASPVPISSAAVAMYDLILKLQLFCSYHQHHHQL